VGLGPWLSLAWSKTNSQLSGAASRAQKRLQDERARQAGRSARQRSRRGSHYLGKAFGVHGGGWSDLSQDPTGRGNPSTTNAEARRGQEHETEESRSLLLPGLLEESGDP